LWYDDGFLSSETPRVSKPTVTRADFQELAAVRLAEAKALLDASMWDGAYYLAGYAVEVGLKACIIKRVQATDAFLEKKYSERCYTHDLRELLVLAGSKASWDAARTKSKSFLEYSEEVFNWSERTRYQRTDRLDAKKLYKAIADTKYGVFKWIQTQW